VSQTAPPPHMSNRAIEDAAIAYVLEWAAHCRSSRDTRRTSAAGDMANVNRTIEVKADGGLTPARTCTSNPAGR
jgi:hypothetical protein